MHTTKFDSDNRGTIACVHCGRLTWDKYSRTRGVNGETCGECAEEFSLENEHSDYSGHPNGAANGDPRNGPTCHPERREARLVKVAKHNETLRIKLDNRTRQARECANVKAAAKAAKEATIKRCAAADCTYGSDGGRGRASKSSDYCSICRPYNPHSVTSMSSATRAFVERQGRDASKLCGTCGLDKGDALHIAA
jgi:hypothetical protein